MIATDRYAVLTGNAARLIGLAALVVLPIAAGCQGRAPANQKKSDPAAAGQTTTPVTVRIITVAELSDLVHRPADKPLVLNIWATWCPPCRAEFPDLVALHRRFSGRPVRFATVSANDPDDAHGKVIEFLRKVHATTENLLVNTGGIPVRPSRPSPMIGTADCRRHSY